MPSRRLAWLLLCALAAALPAQAADEVLTGLVNLARVTELSARVQYRVQIQHDFTPAETTEENVRALRLDDAQRLDAWGTPFHLDRVGKELRIVSAGADRAFARETWERDGQVGSLADDVVFVGRSESRSSRHILFGQLTGDERHLGLHKPSPATRGGAAAMVRLAEAKLLLIEGHLADDLLRALHTMETIERVAATGADSGVDEWGTPLAIKRRDGRVVIVSAGADRKMDPPSWFTPGRSGDPTIDLVYTDSFVRAVDYAMGIQLLVEKQLSENPPRPPKSASFPSPRADGYYLVGGDVKPPRRIAGADPVLPTHIPDEKRRGLVIFEVHVDTRGAVTNVNVLLRRHHPDAIKTIEDTVRRWRFEPGTLDGRPVPTIFSMTLTFD